MNLRGKVPGLRTEIVASVAILSLTAMILVGGVAAQSVRNESVVQQLRSAKQLMDILRVSLSSLYEKSESKNVKEIESQADRIIAAVGGVEVVHVYVTDTHGNILGNNPTGSAFADADLKTSIRQKREIVRVRNDPGFWPLSVSGTVVLSAPLISAQEKVFGGIRLQTKMENIFEGIYKSSRSLLIYLVLIMAVLVLFGSYLIYRNVLFPVQKLMKASERIAEGDYDLAWEGYPSHELGRLAEALKRMAEKLKAHQDALQSKIEELEQSNRALAQANQAIIRSEKLASAGRLASGVAHEIGNPVGAILGYAGLLSGEIQDGPTRDCILRIQSEAERVRRILRTMLDLARPSGTKLEFVDVESVVEETLLLMQGHKEMKNVEVRRSRFDGPIVIRADRDQLQQVLVNLVFNALDAMKGEGVLTVSVGRSEAIPGKPQIADSPRRKGEPEDMDFTHLRSEQSPGMKRNHGPFAVIDVEDTGSGIPEQDIERVFEPFFSTKEPGESTGLGLAVCLGIVESYDGKILVESDTEKGSRFSVFWPMEVEDSVMTGRRAEDMPDRRRKDLRQQPAGRS